MRSLLIVLVLLSAAQDSRGAPPGPSDAGFARAEGQRDFRFPRDHASHPEFATEWWYLTGHLRSPEGELFGFQATWFRNALAPEVPERASRLATRDVVLFHGALTDVGEARFYSDSRISRAASSWAGSSPEQLRVWLLDRRLEQQGSSWRLDVSVEGQRLELELEPTREPLLHGRVPGTSQKGNDAGQASHYYSQTRMAARGTLRPSAEGSAVPVEGTVWFDHEFFSRQLAAEQVGWDWFSVALDDGTDLMLFQLRDRSGEIAPTSSGTLRLADGRRRHLPRDEIELRPVRHWSSPSAGEGDEPYPVEWVIEVPGEGIELRVEPVLDDQEHRGEIDYWEGLCHFRGRYRSQPVEGLGYVELVGYRGGPLDPSLFDPGRR